MGGTVLGLREVRKDSGPIAQLLEPGHDLCIGQWHSILGAEWERMRHQWLEGICNFKPTVPSIHSYLHFCSSWKREKDVCDSLGCFHCRHLNYPHPHCTRLEDLTAKSTIMHDQYLCWKRSSVTHDVYSSHFSVSFSSLARFNPFSVSFSISS